MKLIVVTPIRLFGEGLTSCFLCHEEISLVATVSDLSHLRQALERMEADIVLIDVTQGIDLDEVRAVALERTDIALVALGLQEQRQDVIRCGRAGFSGYVARSASVEELCKALSDVSSGRLACSAEISGGLLRALFRMDRQVQANDLEDALTRREGEVLQLIGQGLSNKEIARDLSLSLATVKHHVHHVLQKLKLPRRAQAMRRVREMPWIASVPGLERHHHE
jgi:two-component system, NarL family, nitrate/nitrite response regulator NarL